MAQKESPPKKLPLPGEPPPSLPNYEGRAELMLFHPEHSVTLDAGVFMWLWRIVENKALLMYNNPTTHQIAPEQVDVALRAVTAFRRSRGQLEERVADPSKGAAKKILKPPVKKLLKR